MVEAFLDALAADLRVARPSVVSARLKYAVAAAGMPVLVLILLILGPRQDFLIALTTSAFWLKIGYTSALAVISLWAIARLARAGVAAKERLWTLIVPLAGVASWASSELWHTSPALREPTAMGRSAMLCSWVILIAAIPIFAGLVWALRGLAPVRLRLTGALAGLASGSIAATLYATHCPESAASFVALWYSLGIAFAGMMGCRTWATPAAVVTET